MGRSNHRNLKNRSPRVAAGGKKPAAMPSSSERDEALKCYLQGDHSRLERHCRQVLEKNPDDFFANINLGDILLQRGEYRNAVEHYHAALKQDSDNLGLHANLTFALCELRQWDEAYRHGKEALRIAPGHAAALTNLSYACNMTQRHREAELAARQVIEQEPGNRTAMNNLASSLQGQGRVHEAIDVLRQILDMDPTHPLAFTNVMLSLQYDERATTEEIVETAKAFDRQLSLKAKPLAAAHPQSPEPWRKLRIGFISPDFNDHAVMYFAEPLITRLDRGQFDIHAYYLYPQGDRITERLRRFVDHFEILGGLTPEAQAERIRANGVDILIDLAGHTAKNGLLAMTHRPAPVQGTWLGYPGTTGMAAIDFRVTDEVADANAEPWEYSEHLYKLPAPFCVYRPCVRHPLARYRTAYDTQPTPALKNGYITFGSCNNLAKLTGQTLATWARVLDAVPDSRLLVEGKSFDDPAIAGPFVDKCVAHGIPQDRLILVQRESARQYLTYHDIDIVLDPFPLTGGTTTMDLLWFGVPMVTMAGEKFRMRMSMTFLHAIGKPEWIAGNADRYVDIAVALASDVPALNAMRTGLRQRVEASPLMDEERFARSFGEVLRNAWVEWCRSRGATITPPLAPAPPSVPLVFLAPGRRMTLADVNGLLIRALAEKDWKQARELATLTLESIPNTHGALIALAEAEWAEGNAQQAVDFLRNAMRIVPSLLFLYDRLASWLRQMNLPASAERVLAVREDVVRQLDAARRTGTQTS